MLQIGIVTLIFIIDSLWTITKNNIYFSFIQQKLTSAKKRPLSVLFLWQLTIRKYILPQKCESTDMMSEGNYFKLRDEVYIAGSYLFIFFPSVLKTSCKQVLIYNVLLR